MAPTPPTTPAQPPDGVPSRLQVALAIAIVKSKPDGISIRDYMDKLRAQLKQGKRPVTNEHGHRHLDVSAYWKDRYDESEQRCRELEHRIVQVERAKDALQARPNPAYFDNESLSAQDGRPATATGSRPTKRKAGASGSSRTVKRHKADNVDKTVKDAQGSFAEDLETLDGLGEGMPSRIIVLKYKAEGVPVVSEELVRHLYTSYKMYAKQKADPEALCSSLLGTARAIGSVISTASRYYDQLAHSSKSSRSSLEKDKSDWSSVIRACSRAFTSVLLGLEKTSECANKQLPGLVVYECIRMFRTILSSISESTQTIAKARRVSVSEPSTNSASSRAKPAPDKDTGPSRTLAHLLIAFFAALRKEDRTHREIFEGMLFVLTERVAKCLFFSTFDHHRSPFIEGDIAVPPNHDHPAVIARHETEAYGIKLEARSLVTILERAVALAPHHLNAPLSLSSTSKGKAPRASTGTLSRTASMRPLQQASRTPLSAQAKDRLQRTLIHCMFGDDGAGEHDEFADVLRMPARLGSVPNMPKVEDKDVGEWFTGEVWRLVGWDLLGKDGQW